MRNDRILPEREDETIKFSQYENTYFFFDRTLDTYSAIHLDFRKKKNCEICIQGHLQRYIKIICILFFID